MKKLALLALPLLMASCNLPGGGSNIQPYNIQMGPFGYEVDDKGKITIPNVTGQVVSAAGAPDVAKITFKGILLDDQGQPAVPNNPTITPFGGTLIAGVKGGYTCSTTPPNECTMVKPDAQFVMTDGRIWPQNAFTSTKTPIEWAMAHIAALKQGGTTPWSIDITFTAEQTNGKSVTWKQNYQFVAPAK